MRIVHLSMLYPPHILGGAERSVAFLAETQAKLGHQVAAACTTPGAFVKEERNGVTVYRMPHETSFWAEEWPKHSKLRRGIRKFMQQFNYKLEDHFGHVLDEFKPDVVHTHSLVDVSTRVWLAAAKRGIPIVHTLRDYDLMCADASLYHDGKPCGLKCKVMTYTKHANHRNVAGVAAVGSETLRLHTSRGYFDHIPKDRQRVIWNAAAVEGSDGTRPPRSGPFTFGYLGRINYEKGVGTMIDAARRLPAGDWRILVAGKANDSLDPFIEQSKGLPIEFAGFMPAKDFFDAIDVLIVPSIWAEPLPRTILESYAVGVPSIGARSGGIPDLIGHDNDGWLYPPGDDAALAERMGRIMAAGRDALPSKADFVHVLKETSPEMVATRYLDFYHDVLAATPALAA
ncbi:glycosyltransferase family 4 protein [Sphingomonas nostoxanthinifaciens]|uniref:glycosyltransferase family 4 protein n=1 Tax=Sphingomonas nostoxanthinifaciens TaxID=2872652 RepID=UPI001CC1FDB1|nr:glycosyltransferase family 4 protein [Sphingomonas nostoxanthinifaciens]UAK23264.1 glycosyltransferase family 4 protein [Sphingomonas nostoxanthinifaciens]